MGAKGFPRPEHRQRFEQIRLPLRVRPDEHVEPRLRREIETRVVAKIRQAHVLEPHVQAEGEVKACRLLPQRLALHTKLSSLALDDAAREDAQKQLQALDRKESDALGAQRNRDQQTLATLQAQLHAHVQTDLNQTARSIQQRLSLIHI